MTPTTMYMESTTEKTRPRVSSDDCSATNAWKLGATKQNASEATPCARKSHFQDGARTYPIYPMSPAVLPIAIACSRPMESETNPPSI